MRVDDARFCSQEKHPTTVSVILMFLLKRVQNYNVFFTKKTKKRRIIGAIR